MVVSEEDYNNCNCTHPIFFSNNGNTHYELDHSGMYYFTSGEEGHCVLGQKMIIKVLNRPDDISPSGPPSNNTQSPPPSGDKHSSAAARITKYNRLASVFSLFVVMHAGFLLD
jgi:Plastocyanin-like domain